MNDEQFKVMCNKLDRIAALVSVQGISNKDAKIRILKKQGFKSKEIGNILGVEESAIRHSEGWKK